MCAGLLSSAPRALGRRPSPAQVPLTPLWPRIPFLLIALGAHPCPQGSLGSETAESGGREFAVTSLSPSSWLQPLLGPLPEGHSLLRSGASWGPQWRRPGCTLSSHRPQGRKRPRGRGTARPAGHQPPEFGPSAPLCLQPCLPRAHPTCCQQFSVMGLQQHSPGPEGEGDAQALPRESLWSKVGHRDRGSHHQT